MGTSDGTVGVVTKILDNGPDFLRFNIVLLAEGYQQSELGQFASDAATFVGRLAATPPYHLVMNAINVHRVDVTSNQSGADDPVTCGGSGASVRTYFDATYCSDGVLHRSLGVDWTLATQVATAKVPAQDVVVVVVNSPLYGGLGNGGVATFSLDPDATDIAIHELGHSGFGLGDEYSTRAGCGSGETGQDTHPASEPAYPNVTTRTNPLKWGRYVLAGTAVPTTKNPDCTKCDPAASPVPPGRVGAFEGSDYYHCGAFRPEFDCKMRTLDTDLCHVCSDVIMRKLSAMSAVNLRLVWKGVGGDQRLYTGHGLDSDQTSLPGSVISSHPPALATTSTGPFLVWKGQGTDQGVYYTRLQHVDDTTWDTPRNVPGAGTSTGSAAASFRGTVHLAWKGVQGDLGIYYTSFPGGLPANPRPVPGVGTSTRPALAVYRDRLFMAWKGIDGDQGIYFTSYDGNGWQAQRAVPGVGTSASPALAVLNDRLFMVWKGIDDHQDVWFTTYDGSSWQPQMPVPGVGTSTGVSLASGPDRLFMAWSGVAGDPSLYLTTFDGGAWRTSRNYFGVGSSGVPALIASF
jgi:hypothetical protein